jgi:hypothetical protein
MQSMQAYDLGEIQERLRQLITEPDGVEAALAASGDSEAAELAELVRGGGGLGPVARLAVYSHAYFARIHDCLLEDFGALARALGPEAFHDLVKTYLMVHAPTRASLRDAGAHLARHLSSAPFDAIFSRRCPYAADLARLEWATIEAFDALDSPVLALADLVSLARSEWAACRFELIPSLRMLTTTWPVHVVRELFDREAAADWHEAPRLRVEATCLRVWRQSERVRYRRISRLEIEALAAARAGASFESICDRLAASRDPADAARAAAGCLGSWVSDGLVARLI